MKDVVNGGIYETFDWKVNKGILSVDIANNSVEITFEKGSSQKFYIVEVLKKITTDNGTFFLLDCIQKSSFDNFTKPVKGKMKLNINNPLDEKESVMIFETEGMIVSYRGQNPQLN